MSSRSFLSGMLALPDRAGEVDVVEHALQARVLLLQGRQGLVEPVADVVVQLVAQVLPAGLLGARRRRPRSSSGGSARFSASCWRAALARAARR